MRRFSALLAVLISIAPIIPTAENAAETGGRIVPPPPDHIRSMRMLGFSPAFGENVSSTADQGLELGVDLPYSPRPEAEAASAAAEHPSPDLAFASSGIFTVAWQDNRSGNMDIHAQRYGSNGSRVGAEIVLGEPDRDEISAAIAVNTQDQMMIAYSVNDTGRWSVRAQRLDFDGLKLGTEIMVADDLGGPGDPALAAVPYWGFVVAWTKVKGKPDAYFQRFDSSGSKLGNPTPVFSGLDERRAPSIAAVQNGGYVIAVESTYGANHDIVAYLYEKDGNSPGSSMAVNGNSHDAGRPSVAADRNGRFVIAWERNGGGVAFQRFNADKTRLGAVVTIPSMGSVASAPSVAADSKGRFAIAWERAPPTGGNHGVNVTVYDNDGQKLDELPASEAANDSCSPSIATGPRDSLVIAWESGPDSGAGRSVNHRSYHLNYVPRGYIDMTESGNDLVWWQNVSCEYELADPSQHRVTVYLSNDQGSSWEPVPANGSLGAAVAGTLYLRVILMTGNPETSPVFYSMALTYVSNRAPAVTLPTTEYQGWKKEPVKIRAFGTDGDGDSLTYNWTQTAGPPLSFDANSQDLSFNVARSGNFSFRVEAGDWYEASEPAFINMTIRNRPPEAYLFVDNETVYYPFQPILFDATLCDDPDDNITAYNYHFGDGTESGWIPKNTVTHAYPSVRNYRATVTVRDEEGNETESDFVSINVTRNPAPQIIISKPLEGSVLTTRTAVVEFRLFNFVVKEGSNHIHFELDDLPAVMWYSLSPCSFSGLAEGSHTLRATLENETHRALTNPEASATVNFTVRPSGLPDLAVSASNLTITPGKPKDGDLVTLEVIVHNTGDKDAPAFGVRFLVDGEVIGDRTLPGLAKGSGIESRVTWKAKSGSHNLTVALDPDGAVDELDESNNYASIGFIVPGAAEGMAPGLTLALIGAVIVTVVVAAVAAVVLMRRKKPAPAGAYQPPPATLQPPPPSTGTVPPPPLK